MERDERPVMVTIRCLVYNHEAYIRQCLEGFVMQQTNFRFEAIVHDDASTDGSAAIIREYAEKYPDIIKPILQKENQYSKHDGSITRIMNERIRGKYIAYCEGDDYWTDPLKLQKQVDFLERHPDYVMCSHYFQVYLQDEQGFSGIGPLSEQENKEYDIDSYIAKKSWLTQPLSAVYLNIPAVYESYIKCKYTKDLTLFYFLLKHGKGFLMSDVMAVYRLHSNGVWTGASRQAKIYADLCCINGIYEVDDSKKKVAILLRNHLKQSGYLGLSFFKSHMNVYKKSILYIYRELGLKQFLSVVWRNIKFKS